MAKKNHFRAQQQLAKQQTAIQAGTDAARQALRTGDSFVNFSARLGFGAGSQQDASHYRPDFVSRNPFNMESAYRSNWLCGMAVDVVAQDMTRAGIEFQSDQIKPDDAKLLHDEFEKLGLWDGLCDGVKWGRLYGGCVVVMLIDGQALNTPLRIDTIDKDQFKGVIALDRWQVNPTLMDLVTEFGPDLGKPKYYDVNTSAKALIGERIHYSRVIRIDGLPLPWRQALAENGWGQSVLERLWDRVIAFDSASEGAAQLTYKAHLRTMKIKGLRELVAMGGKPLEGVVAQMQMMRQYQTNEGLTLMDADDEFETHQYTFAGLPDILLQFGQQISGALGIPLVRLFGQSPAGLNATGESDLEMYDDNITAQQDQKLRPGVGTLCHLVHRSVFGQPLPDGFEFTFNPLRQMSNEEKANVAKTGTEAICAAEAAAIISPQTAAKELQQLSRTTGIFTHLTDDEVNKLEDEPPEPADIAVDPNAAGLPGAAPAPAKLKAVE